jgi:hypothetical protein
VSWKEAIAQSGVHTALIWVALIGALALLGSQVVPALYRKRSGVPAPGTYRLIFLSLVWLLPVWSLAVTRQLPADYSWGRHRHDISGLFLHYWYQWPVHHIEQQFFPNGPWERVRRDTLFRAGVWGGLDRLEQYMWYARGSKPREHEVWFAITEWATARLLQYGSDGLTNRPCAVRLVRQVFSPLDARHERHPFTAADLGPDWIGPQVLSVVFVHPSCG